MRVQAAVEAGRHLVVFQRAFDVESMPSLAYSSSYIRVRLHNIPQKSMAHETGEAMGNIFGTTIQVADPEVDGSDEFLRVCVSIDITKPLP
nr:hypothetical protein CFP56_50997 [Quercus suber]